MDGPYITKYSLLALLFLHIHQRMTVAECTNIFLYFVSHERAGNLPVRQVPEWKFHDKILQLSESMGLLGCCRLIGRCRAAFKQVSAAAAAVFWKQPLYAHREKKENAVKKAFETQELEEHHRWPLLQSYSVQSVYLSGKSLTVTPLLDRILLSLIPSSNSPQSCTLEELFK